MVFPVLAVITGKENTAEQTQKGCQPNAGDVKAKSGIK